MEHTSKLIQQQFGPSRYSPVRRYIVLLAFMSQVFVFNEKANSATVFVSKQGDNTTGEAWSTSFKTVSSALTAATSGDQIWIASGTYFDSVILKPDTSLYGGFVGNETNLNQRNPSINSTIIDGSTANASVIFGAKRAVLDGLQIRGGSSDIGGGGLRCENASMMVKNCNIKSNYATSLNSTAFGGGVFCVSSEFVFQDCVFTGNRVELLPNPDLHIPIITAYGGGICALQSKLRIERCTICDNLSNCSDGSDNVISVGGGIYANGVVECTDCVFSANKARAVYSSASYARGGGIGLIGTMSLTNCIIDGNTAEIPLNLAPAYAEGGGIYATGVLSIENSVLLRNMVSARAINAYGISNAYTVWCNGALTLSYSDILYRPEWTNDAFEPKSIVVPIGSLDISNSLGRIVELGDDVIEVDVTYSNILHGFPGEGNINLDPRFVDPENGDFRLLASSPCIDAGTTTGPATDILGKTRPVDVPGVGRDGAGAFDMGAYEFQLSDLPTPTPTPTMTETPTITPTATMTDTPTATPTATRDPNASWIRKWDLYR